MGPLAGMRIVEMAGVGPTPFCGMLLADLGAEVIRIDRLTAADLGFEIEPRFDFTNRSKRVQIEYSDSGRGASARNVQPASRLVGINVVEAANTANFDRLQDLIRPCGGGLLG